MLNFDISVFVNSSEIGISLYFDALILVLESINLILISRDYHKPSIGILLCLYVFLFFIGSSFYVSDTALTCSSVLFGFIVIKAKLKNPNIKVFAPFLIALVYFAIWQSLTVSVLFAFIPCICSMFSGCLSIKWQPRRI
jgi:hypothetical protein